MEQTMHEMGRKAIKPKMLKQPKPRKILGQIKEGLQAIPKLPGAYIKMRKAKLQERRINEQKKARDWEKMTGTPYAEHLSKTIKKVVRD